MAKKVGQHFFSGSDTFLGENLNDGNKITPDYMLTASGDNEVLVNFIDLCFPLNGILKAGESYYIKFKLTRYDKYDEIEEDGVKKEIEDKHPLTLGFALQNKISVEYGESAVIQNIDRGKMGVGIKDGENENIKEFELIFTPNQNGYNYFVVRIIRTISDYTINNNKNLDTIKTKMNLEEIDGTVLALINGSLIVRELNNLISSKEYTKLGIQTNPGTLFQLNGEPIRVGKSGFYEMLSGDIRVKSLGAYIDNNDQPFIVDYQYED